MTKVPGRDVLDKLLHAIEKEMSGQLLTLQEMRQKAGKLHNPSVENRLDKLTSRKTELISIGMNDNGEAINPDIEEGMNWLENEGIPNLEEAATELSSILDDQIESLQNKVDELRALIKDIPSNSFFYNLEEDEDEENENGEGNEPTTEAELQKEIREWRKDYDKDTVELFEIQTRMRTGIGLE